MRKLTMLLAASGAVLAGACSDGVVTTGNGSLTVNTSAIGSDISNNAEAAGNMARNGARSVGNGLDRAGEVISNNAKAAWNEVRETARDIGVEGQGNASGNAAGR